MGQQNSKIQGTPSDPGMGPGVVVAGSQTYDPPSRFITVSTAGTLTGTLVGDANDVAYVLPVGTHKLAFKSCTSISSLVAFISR